MTKHLAMTAAVGAAALIGGVIVVSVARAGDDDRKGERMSAYKQTNLVSSVPGLARTTDPNLKNPWGVAASLGGALWVSDNATNKSTLYDGEGNILPPNNPLVVDVPGGPTGIVFNPRPDLFHFMGPKGDVPAVFMFATEEGTIRAWNPALGTQTAVVVSAKGHRKTVYKGLALGVNSGGVFIFAADFAGNEIEVYDSNFKEVSHDGKHGKKFHDPHMPRGFSPFGIHNINNDLFVTYARRSNEPGEEQPGAGIVNVFNTDGDLLRRFATTEDPKKGPLNAPWGVALATHGFGKFAGALLVGNFGNGMINAFDYSSGKFLGELRDQKGNPIMIDGLWSLRFGDFANSDSGDLYFTAGIQGEKEGLYGEIEAVSSGKKD